MINGKIRLKVGVIISILGLIMTILSLLLPSAFLFKSLGYLFLIFGAFLIYPEAKKIDITRRTKMGNIASKDIERQYSKWDKVVKLSLIVSLISIVLIISLLLSIKWSVSHPGEFPQIKTVEIIGPHEMKVIDEDFSDYQFTAILKNVGGNGYVDISGGLKDG